MKPPYSLYWTALGFEIGHLFMPHLKILAEKKKIVVNGNHAKINDLSEKLLR